MDGHIMRFGTIGSCQSAATSEIVKRCWSRVIANLDLSDVAPGQPTCEGGWAGCTPRYHAGTVCFFSVRRRYRSTPTTAPTSQSNVRYSWCSSVLGQQRFGLLPTTVHALMSRLTSSFTCQLISIIITTLIIHHSFTLSLQAQNLPFQQILPTLDFFYLPDAFMTTGLDRISCSSFYF